VLIKLDNGWGPSGAVGATRVTKRPEVTGVREVAVAHLSEILPTKDEPLLKLAPEADIELEYLPFAGAELTLGATCDAALASAPLSKVRVAHSPQAVISALRSLSRCSVAPAQSLLARVRLPRACHARMHACTHARTHSLTRSPAHPLLA
jgi:hypothetical protein